MECIMLTYIDIQKRAASNKYNISGDPDKSDNIYLSYDFEDPSGCYAIIEIEPLNEGLGYFVKYWEIRTRIKITKDNPQCVYDFTAFRKKVINDIKSLLSLGVKIIVSKN